MEITESGAVAGEEAMAAAAAGVKEAIKLSKRSMNWAFLKARSTFFYHLQRRLSG